MASGFNGLIDDLVAVQRLRSADPTLIDRLNAGDDRATALSLRKALLGNEGAHEAGRPAAAMQSWDSLQKAVDTQLKPLRPTRAQRIAEVRAKGQATLEKAMRGFAAGTITAHEVNQLEVIVGNMVRMHVDAPEHLA